MNLRGNSLIHLPPEVGSFSALCTLDLSCNKLKVLPEMIGQVTSLKELDLSDNPDLSHLPRSFIGLVKVIKQEQMPSLKIYFYANLSYVSLYSCAI